MHTTFKLNIGCGGAWRAEGWIGIDQRATAGIWQSAEELQFLDLDVRKGLPFPANSADVVFSSHALEHFTYEEAVALLFEMYRVLKVGAPLCLVVPDMDLYISGYVNRDQEFLTTPEIIGGTPRGNLADNFLMNFYSDPRFNNTCHKYAYNFENLSSILRMTGFDEVERVSFHEFSYWPELREPVFRSPLKHIERFSLSVQCRKTKFDPAFREHPALQEARKYAHSGVEPDLVQQVNSLLLLNEGLTAQHAQAVALKDGLTAELHRQAEEIRLLQGNLAAHAEQAAQYVAAEAVRAQDVARLHSALQQCSQDALTHKAKFDGQALRISTLEGELQRGAGNIRALESEVARRARRIAEVEAELSRASGRVLAMEAEAAHKAHGESRRVAELLQVNAELERLGTPRPRPPLWKQFLAKLVWSGRYLQFYLRDTRSPQPAFDRRWYQKQYPDVAGSSIPPLLHYLMWGAPEGRDPSSQFSTEWYLRRNPDVAALGVNPLVHYELIGATEGRTDRRVSLPQPAPVPAPVSRPAAPASELQRALALSASGPTVSGASTTRYSPLISVLVPTYNTPARYLKEVIQSVVQQTYENWELCLVDDGSTNQDCLEILRDTAKSNKQIRVKFRTANGGIAESSEDALQMAQGEFIAFLDHDDLLAPNALSEAVHLLRQDPSIDMIYTDHAMMETDGTLRSPALKPAWSPEFFLSTNYIVHLKILRRSTVLSVGGFSGTIHVAQDIGLTCKLLESGVRIRHLPKILYYWRIHQASVASGTSAKPAIQAAALQTYNRLLERKGVPAKLIWPECFRDANVGAYKLDFPSTSAKRVAIIIPALNREWNPAAFYPHFQRTEFSPLPEVHVIGPKAQTTFAVPGIFFHAAKTQAEFNAVVASIDCDIAVFLSPTARTLSAEWLKELVGYLSVSPEIGAVGGKILDDRLTIRSGGLLLLNEVHPICAGQVEEADGYWLNNRIASNTEAVSARLMATPKPLYTDLAGLPFFEYGDAAGLAYCLKLREAGFRIVYTPWSKIIDPTPETMPKALGAMIEKAFGATAWRDRYYHPFFSQNAPYTVR